MSPRPREGWGIEARGDGTSVAEGRGGQDVPDPLGAGIGTLAVFHQVAGRFTGPEPSAPLWILLPARYMKGARIGQAVASRQFKQIRRTTPRVSTSRAGPCRR